MYPPSSVVGPTSPRFGANVAKYDVSNDITDSNPSEIN
jgi:hypothetical protein